MCSPDASSGVDVQMLMLAFRQGQALHVCSTHPVAMRSSCGAVVRQGLQLISFAHAYVCLIGKVPDNICCLLTGALLTVID